ncbi:MAG: SURF1 family protein, partial [Acetobacteraceae bacterium]|nr:SURF1 family protein [Acetobacteraceae bacterium]
ELLARITAAEAGPAVPLGREAPPRYTRIAVTGRLDHAREALLGLEVRGTTLGAYILTPLMPAQGGPPLLVLRGWVPLERSQPIARPEGEVTVTGYVRPGEVRGGLAATDDAAGRRFYTFDPPVIAAALGLSGVEPFGLVLLAAPDAPANALPVAARAIPRPTNSHLGYAITWYGLAAALVGVFAAYARRVLKETPPP